MSDDPKDPQDPKDPARGAQPNRGATPSVGRRGFLRMTAGAVSLLGAACGDDAAGAGGTESGTGTGTGNGTTGGTGSTGGGSGSASGSTTGGPDPDMGGTGPVPACEADAVEVAFDPDAVAQSDLVFPMAVMSGEMTPSSVILTTHIPDAQTKRLKVWRPTETNGNVILVKDQDGYVKETLDDLCPGTWYRYAYFDGDPDAPSSRSVVGEFRTAFDEDTLEPLTVAITSCTYTGGPWPALQAMYDEYYDAILHLGDQIYNDDVYAAGGTLEQYRQNWITQLSHPDYKTYYSRSGLYVTWDDHEVTDNGDFDRRTADPVEVAKRDNALDSFFELMPVAMSRQSFQLWRSFRWGKTAEIIVLDCRYERKPSQGIYISPEQMAFLKDRLLNSTAQFKIVMNSVPITNMPLVWDIAANDRWEGFPNQRNEVRDFINDNDIGNVWWISGDFHVCFVSTLESGAGDRFGQQYEITTTTGNTNPAGFLLGGAQFPYGVSDPRGCILTFDPQSDTVNVRFIDPDTGQDDYNADLSRP